MKTIPRKRGRPKIHDNPVWIGIKTSQKKREMIKKFTREQGKPASKFILEIVTEAIQDRSKLPKRMTIHELMKLSVEERGERLRAQAKHAEWIYNNDPDIIFPDNQDIIEY